MRSRRLIRREVSWLEAVAEASAHLAALGFHCRAAGDESPGQPVLLCYTPPARTNPYQALLYNRALHHGVAPLPVGHWTSLTEIPWPGRMICHFHWIANILDDAASDQEADDRIGELAELLTSLREQGRRIAWTAHNVLPHDTSRPEKDVALRQVLVEAADIVHVMAPNTVAELSEHVELSEARTIHVPHAAYSGAYPDFVSRAEARSELGMEPDDFVFLLFGALQRYKGVDELLSAFERLLADSLSRPARLIIAGHAADPVWARGLQLWATGNDAAVILAERIPVEDVQYLYRAADLAVLPYRRALNSGAAMLALTFGVPFLAPAMGGLQPLVDRFGCPSFRGGDEDALYRTMRAAMSVDLGPIRARIADGIGDLAPPKISDLFFDQLLSHLGWPSRADAADPRQLVAAMGLRK